MADVVIESGWVIKRVYLDPLPGSTDRVLLKVDVYADNECNTIKIEVRRADKLILADSIPSSIPIISHETTTLLFDLTVQANDTAWLSLKFIGCEIGYEFGWEVLNSYFVSESDTVALYVGNRPGQAIERTHHDEYLPMLYVPDMSPFLWTTHEVRGKTIEKGSILVPITVKGSDKKLYAQLDTGCDHTPLYGPALRAFGIDFDSTTNEGIAFIWGNLDDYWIPADEWVLMRWNMGQNVDPDSHDPIDRIVGTIGLDQIIDRVLILDFPGAQLAVIDDTALIDRIVMDTVHYVPATIGFNKFYVDVVLGEDTLKSVRYDSGSSSETLILPKDLWQRTTGLTGDEAHVIRDSAQSWGNYVHFLTAPATGDLSFGPVTVPTPLVTYVDWPDPTMQNMLLMGNAPFADSFVVVLDCIGNRFGVSKIK
jgi:hypothetical protein